MTNHEDFLGSHDNSVETKGAIFVVSPSRYMCDGLGFAYISEHFEPATRPKVDVTPSW